MNKIVLILLTCLLLPVLAFAHPEGTPDGSNSKGREKFMDELGVTPEQKAKLKDLKESKQDLPTEFEGIKKLKAEMENLLKDPNSSESDVLTKSKELGDKISQIHENRIKHLLAMKKILTPEQFSKLLDKMHDKFDGMKPKFGKKD